ncbi:MAG: hypothetical protein KA015_00480 [Spirochaetes bacterium]|nr:hypothetical protein [Spirochaetota bacterium]
MSNYFITHDKYAELCHKLLAVAEKNEIHYDGIICPLKGGFFLSYFMSRNLALPIKYVEISSYCGKNRGEFIVGEIPELSSGTYLLCDDIYDSGETVRKIKEIYCKIKIDVFVLVSKQNLNEIVAGEIIGADTWVDFFWEHI